MNTVTFPSQGGIDRRRFLKGLALGGVVAGTGLWRLPVHAANPELPLLQRHTTPLELRIGQSSVNFTGRMRPAITVNNSLPGPVLRWRQGDTVQIHVTNTLPDVMTSIHWHGIVLPSNMDGVPGMSFDGIAPGEHYLYRFQLHQSGTYWYHSHAMFQEQAGLYGALIIDPLEPPPTAPTASTSSYSQIGRTWTLPHCFVGSKKCPLTTTPTNAPSAISSMTYAVMACAPHWPIAACGAECG